MMHNHHGQTRPDKKIAREVFSVTSEQNKALKKRAAKKRRQRDKGED